MHLACHNRLACLSAAAASAAAAHDDVRRMPLWVPCILDSRSVTRSVDHAACLRCLPSPTVSLSLSFSLRSTDHDERAKVRERESVITIVVDACSLVSPCLYSCLCPASATVDRRSKPCVLLAWMFVFVLLMTCVVSLFLYYFSVGLAQKHGKRQKKAREGNGKEGRIGRREKGERVKKGTFPSPFPSPSLLLSLLLLLSPCLRHSFLSSSLVAHSSAQAELQYKNQGKKNR